LNWANLAESNTINSNTMADNSKFLTGLIIGAAAGAAIALLLNTEKGKEIVADLKAAAADAIDELKDKAAGFGADRDTAV
jgi:gas vesicle protein